VTDKEIVMKLMYEHFQDDNTFSASPKEFALIGVMAAKDYIPEVVSVLADSDFMPEIEIKLVDLKTFVTEYYSKNFRLKDLMGTRPVIQFVEE